MPIRHITRTKRRLTFLCTAIVVALALDYALYPFGETSAPKFDHAQNGVWLAFDFAQGKAKETPSHLAMRMHTEGFQDLYFLVRYIGESGRLRFDIHASAQKFNEKLRESDPSLRRFAWVYVGNARGITGVDIARPEIRDRIANECAKLINDGFDGIHLDYEICSDGDADFLKLLDAIRARTSGHPLSVATPMWLPSPLGAYGWSEAYFALVAAHSDQIVVMAYDSALYFPRHYSWLLRQQCWRVPRAAAGINCRILIGVPSYEDGGLSHHPRAENLRVALRAVREGLIDNPNANRVDGVALFADYSTDADEWATWRHDWR
ncbi:hypothetical protein IAD21_05370 [Abditibacteriota bacterium]|nr:hypothetical protein IAD21_05370 [Abditibacteriota bacterium]